MYPKCDGLDLECVTTVEGSGLYDLDCPCFDEYESNVIGQGVPGYVKGGDSCNVALLPNSSPSATPNSNPAGDPTNGTTDPASGEMRENISMNAMVSVAIAVLLF
mmetsp:Transcript_42447/g.49605  ORF Transcript_42447/g.49605 Transcript_42447/m.49605 type:complete len:105 (-) Transcript_42447:147-461(-)